MKVLKFGGTSVGSVKSILSLKKIVEKEAKNETVIVVVSALGGITDKLIATSHLALKHDDNWKVEFNAMVDRHHKMIDTIITDTKKREDLFNTVDALFEQLKSIYFGVYLIHDLIMTVVFKIGITSDFVNPLFAVPLTSFLIFCISFFVIFLCRKISISKYIM